MRIAVKRVAWKEIEPAEGSELRITFDTNLMYRDLQDKTATEDSFLIDQSEAIMEIKNVGPLPMWLVRALSKHQIKPSSFSKYGEAYRLVTESSLTNQKETTLELTA